MECPGTPPSSLASIRTCAGCPRGPAALENLLCYFSCLGLTEEDASGHSPIHLSCQSKSNKNPEWIAETTTTTGPTPRLPPETQARQRVCRTGGDRRGQLLAAVARPLLAQGGRNDVHALGGRVDPSVDCRRHW